MNRQSQSTSQSQSSGGSGGGGVNMGGRNGGGPDGRGGITNIRGQKVTKLGEGGKVLGGAGDGTITKKNDPNGKEAQAYNDAQKASSFWGPGSSGAEGYPNLEGEGGYLGGEGFQPMAGVTPNGGFDDFDKILSDFHNEATSNLPGWGNPESSWANSSNDWMNQSMPKFNFEASFGGGPSYDNWSPSNSGIFVNNGDGNQFDDGSFWNG